MVKIIIGDRVCKQGQLAVGCSAAIFDDRRQRILLIRRSDNGRWAVPGGYMEPGESLTEACAREVLEETGLEVQVGRLISIYSNPHRLLEYSDAKRLQLVILHFEADPVGGSLRLSDETSDVKYISQPETAGLEIGPLDQARIEDAFADQAQTIVRDKY